jgi:hypothetical protein
LGFAYIQCDADQYAGALAENEQIFDTFCAVCHGVVSLFIAISLYAFFEWEII